MPQPQRSLGKEFVKTESCLVFSRRCGLGRGNREKTNHGFTRMLGRAGPDGNLGTGRDHARQAKTQESLRVSAGSLVRRLVTNLHAGRIIDEAGDLQESVGAVMGSEGEG
jgi:hypothetical protein